MLERNLNYKSPREIDVIAAGQISSLLGPSVVADGMAAVAVIVHLLYYFQQQLYKTINSTLCRPMDYGILFYLIVN